MAALSPKLSPTLLLLLLSLLAGPPPAASADKLKTFSAIYPNFTDSDYYRRIFAVEDPATINNGSLQITLDSAGDVVLTNQSGRIFLKNSFKLWPGSGGPNITGADRVASFNTSFLINIYRMNNTRINNDTPGEGLAFVVAPDLKIPPNSYGQFLGLTNSTTDGADANQILAVELDTFNQSDIGDPDANHVGLDINSVRSDNVTSLKPYQMVLAPGGGRSNFFNIWVEYDGIKKVIEVYIAQQQDKNGPTPPKPTIPVLRKVDLDLRSVVNQFSYFGFSASTGNVTELNCVLRWNLTVEYFKPSNNALKIGLGVGVPMVVLLAGAGLGYYLHKKRAAGRSNSSILGALKSLPGMPREFGFKDLKRATGNFDERNKLGQGGFGVVYRGFIQSENLEVAVKCFSRESIKGEDDFLAELTIINRLRHKHLVRLLGWCHKNGKLLLVYEYMPNGSLDKHLFGDADDKPLSWNLRYKIISGVASALHYLHNEYDQKVVHRDLKASNIMLDSNFNARLGDFGLARALDNEKTSYAEAEGVLGTMGYIAPECFHTGKATQQSDVYAFGAVLLEVVCGLRPGTKIGGFQLLVDWVWCLHREGRLLEAVDERLGQDYVAEEAERVLLLGLACSHPGANERPRTQAIVQIISGSVAAPSVPPFKPPFVWPSMPVGLEDDTETDASQATITTDTRSFAIASSQYGSGWRSPRTLSRGSYTPFNNDKFNFTPYNSDNYNKV